jgi:reactive intermediate/imine deaminase
MPTPIKPAALATPGGHYSHAVVANGMVFVSGQLPIDASGKKLVGASFEDQARQVLANVAGALEAAGSGVASLVQVRVYVTDIAHWPAFDAIYAAWAGASRPTRAVVPVPMLHHGLLIEIEAVATL